MEMKTKCLMSMRTYDDAMRALFKEYDPETDTYHPLVLRKGVNAFAPPCSKTVVKQAKAFIEKLGFELQFTATGDTLINTTTAVMKTVECAVQQAILSDPNYQVPASTFLQIQVDSANQGNRKRTPVAVKVPDIHPKPQSPDALTPVAIITTSDAVEELRERCGTQIAELGSIKKVEIDCRCRHGGHDGGKCKMHKHIMLLHKLVGGDLHFLMKAFGLGPCSCSNPCFYCRISKDQLSLFDHTELARFAERTMKEQIGMSTYMLYCPTQHCP